jgi:hypothetical protein
MKTIFLLILAISLAGCGQKSTIKNAVKSQRLAEAYGDGKYIIKDLTFPLDDSAMAYETPLPGLAPIVGGIMKIVGDVFAKNTDMGKLQMNYIQPIPEIPTDILKSVRLKRVFFYMKPKKTKRRIRDWFSRLILGHGHVTFDFLGKFAIRAATTHLNDPDNYVSTIVTKEYDKNEVSSLMEVFSPNYRGPVVDTENAKEVVLFKYSNKTKAQDTRNKTFGQIHVLETSGDPKVIKYFLMEQPNFSHLYKRILIFEQSILVELKKDPLAEEAFRKVMADSADDIEALGVNYVDTCDARSCLELNLADVNLIPIAVKGNALKLDGVIHANNVPESFNLKGFVEFEVKLDSPI